MSSSNFEECIKFVEEHVPQTSCDGVLLVFYDEGKISTVNILFGDITFKSLVEAMFGDSSHSVAYVSNPFATSLDQMNRPLDYTSDDNITVGEMKFEQGAIIHTSKFPAVITTLV